MKQPNLIQFLMQPKNWWLPLLIIFTISMAGVVMIGTHTYTEAPPIPNFVGPDGKKIFTSEDIMKGQGVFQKYALMEYGSMFGDGAYRGPDYSAEALHLTVEYMTKYYGESNNSKSEDPTIQQYGISEMVKREIKANHFSQIDNSVVLTNAQVFAAQALSEYYIKVFTTTNSEQSFKPQGYLTDKNEIRELSAFFFWSSLGLRSRATRKKLQLHA